MNELTNIESTIVSSYSPLPCSAAAAAAAGRGGEGTNRARACRQFLASLASKRRSPSDRSLGEGAAPRFNLYTQKKRSVIRFSDSDSTLSHAENFFRFVSPLSLLIIPRSWFSVPRSCLSLSLSLSPPPPPPRGRWDVPGGREKFTGPVRALNFACKHIEGGGGGGGGGGGAPETTGVRFPG